MKIAIIGSSGKVAKQLIQYAFTFNRSPELELAFFSHNPQLVQAHVLDCRSTNAFLAGHHKEPRFKITADYADLAGSDAVFVCAGLFMPDDQKEKFRPIDPSGRLAHAFANVNLTHNIAGEIRKYCPDANVVIVTNQSDMMAELARQTLNPEKVFGMGGAIDEARFKKLLEIALNTWLPEGEKIAVHNIGVEIVGYHNNHMLCVQSSLRFPDRCRKVLEDHPGLLDEVLTATKNYGRDISKHRDPRHPGVNTGSSIGPGAACWSVIAALSGQASPIRTSFNTRLQGTGQQSYGIPEGTPLSVPVVVSDNRMEQCPQPAPCSEAERRALRAAIQDINANMATLEQGFALL